MILDLVRVSLFPALMAFAAASDLLTMTISNRVSQTLVAGFLVVALASGMGLSDILLHAGAGSAVLAVALFFLSLGWVRRGAAQVGTQPAPFVRFCHLVEYTSYCLSVRC